MEKDLLEGFARYLDSRPALVRQASNSGLPSITISRQMGAGGIEIAELLADRLAESSRQAWMVFDRNLAEIVWKDHNLPGPVGPFFPGGGASSGVGCGPGDTGYPDNGLANG